MLERATNWLFGSAAKSAYEQKVAEVRAWRRRGAPLSETPPQLLDPFFDMPDESWQVQFLERKKAGEE